MKTIKFLPLCIAIAAFGFSSCMKQNEPATTNPVAEKNKAAMLRVNKMFENGKTDGLEELVAVDMIEHSPAPGIKTTGLQGLKDIIAMHHAAFPDTKITVLNMWADSNMGVMHYNMKGLNTGPMGPMKATGKMMDVNGVDIVRFVNGKGIEHWGYWEESKMMTQLGMMPPMDEEKMEGKKTEEKKEDAKAPKPDNDVPVQKKGVTPTPPIQKKGK